MDFSEWRKRHPEACAELDQVLAGEAWNVGDVAHGKPEQVIQSELRLKISKAGAWSWRNNVGATRARIDQQCPACGFKFYFDQQPIRYGLANDSTKLNASIKSSDLILAIPRVIEPHHVGTTIAQFGAVEVKTPGWKGPKNEHERAQEKWLALINRIGGAAAFSTGEYTL